MFDMYYVDKDDYFDSAPSQLLIIDNFGSSLANGWMSLACLQHMVGTEQLQ